MLVSTAQQYNMLLIPKHETSTWKTLTFWYSDVTYQMKLRPKKVHTEAKEEAQTLYRCMVHEKQP